MLLPESPAPDTYGFRAGGKLRTCTREELVRNCSMVQIPDVSLVWTPDHPRMVPMTETPVLRPALEERVKSAMRMAILNLVFGLILVGANAGGGGARPIWPLLALFFVIPAVQSLVDSIAERRALARRFAQPAEARVDVAARFGYWLSAQPARVTLGLAAAIGLVAAGQVARGLAASVADAGLVKDAVRAGEAWRLTTAGFLHAGPIHFVVNVAALLSLGRTVEVLAHWSRLCVVFAAAVVAGAVASVLFMPEATSVGASGGLMGLLGFLLVLGRRRAGLLPAGFARSLVTGILWVAAAGILGRGFIDNAAHAGGLVAGLALGISLVPRDGAVPLAAGRPTVRAGLGAGAVLAATALGTAALLLGAFLPR